MIAKDIDLSAQVAFVTGGGGGIGRASAISLAEMGADIVILESIPERCNETTALIEKLGRKCLAINANAMDADAVIAAVDQAAQKFGRIDVLVNNVGGVARKCLADRLVGSLDRRVALDDHAISLAHQLARATLVDEVERHDAQHREHQVGNKGIDVQPAGPLALLLDHGRGILHQVERAREDLGRLRGGLSGHVAVGLPTSVARVLTVPLTRAFREALPEARLSISEGLSGSLQESLAAGRLDIVVLYNAQPSREIDITPLQEEDLLRQLRPNIDGLIIEERHGLLGLRRATFLPSVWGSLPDPVSFLSHLKTKAGMPDGYWSDRVKVWRYTAVSVHA